MLDKSLQEIIGQVGTAWTLPRVINYRREGDKTTIIFISFSLTSTDYAIRCCDVVDGEMTAMYDEDMEFVYDVAGYAAIKSCYKEPGMYGYTHKYADSRFLDMTFNEFRKVRKAENPVTGVSIDLFEITKWMRRPHIGIEITDPVREATVRVSVSKRAVVVAAVVSSLIILGSIASAIICSW